MAALSCLASLNPPDRTVRPDSIAQYEAVMWNTVFLTAALALGQPGDSLPDIAPVAPPPLKALAAPQFSKAAAEPPAAPAALAPADAPAILPAPDQPPAAADQPPAPVNIVAPLLPTPPPAAPAAAAAPYKPPVWP